jgi:hypothetical protein
MGIIEDLKKRAHATSKPPSELTITSDQADELAEYLQGITYKLTGVPKVTGDSLRENGGWIFGIPLRVIW